MLETLCMSPMHDSVFWFVSAGYVLCCTSDLVVASEGKIILLVQSQVWLLHCSLYLLQELWEYYYRSLLFCPYF